MAERESEPNIFDAGFPASLLQTADGALQGALQRKLANQLSLLNDTPLLGEVETAQLSRAKERKVARSDTVKAAARFSAPVLAAVGRPQHFGCAPSQSSLTPSLADWTTPESSKTRKKSKGCFDVLLQGIGPDAPGAPGAAEAPGAPDAPGAGLSVSLKVHERIAAGAAEKDERRAARLKHLVEEQKHRRIRKIKSKTFRKIRRKAIDGEREKLLSVLSQSQPDLARDLQSKFEEQRAEVRLLKTQKARQKWAKLARRYGGSSMQPAISEQEQLQTDKRRLLERLAKTNAVPAEDRANRGSGGGGGGGHGGDDSSTDVSTDDGGDGDGDNDGDDDETRAEAIRQIADLISTSAAEPQTGVYAMKFMSKAREASDARLLAAGSAAIHELAGRTAPRDDYAATEEGDFAAAEHKLRQRAELAKSRLEELLKLPPKGGAIGNADGNAGGNASGNAGGGGGGVASVASDELLQRFQENKRKRKRPYMTKDGGAVLGDDGDDSNAAILIREAFDGNCQAAPQESDADESESEAQTQASKVASWFEWTGEGVVPTKRKKKSIRDTVGATGATGATGVTGATGATGATGSTGATSGAVVINPTEAETLNKYFAPQVPFPYTSSGQFNAAFKVPLGPEWNTVKGHDTLAAPMLVMRPGAALPPLQVLRQMAGSAGRKAAAAAAVIRRKF